MKKLILPVGVSAAQAAQALKAFAKALKNPTPSFFKVEARDDGFLVTYYNPERHSEICDWFQARGYNVQKANGVGWHIYSVDKNTVIQAKLTFGGAA